jgi:hypothetical protein
VIRAYVADDPRSFGVAISIVKQPEDNAYPREIFRPAGDAGGVMDFRLEPVAVHAAVEPTMILPDYMARALLDALTAHYHGAEDTRALRRDYDAERGRVDRLIEHLAVIAKQATTPPFPLSLHGAT